jgi:carbonic anhydrase
MKSIKQLAHGFTVFREKFFEKNSNLFNKLVVSGQTPRVAIVACSDSRVDPAILLQAEPGDIFAIRNVANLVPPYEQGCENSTGAALEFAVCQLGVSNIVVFGHAHCAGISALLEQDSRSDLHDDFISSWTDIAAKAKDSVQGPDFQADSNKQARACEQAAIMVSIENLMTFPWIRKRVEQKSLRLHGWYIDITIGELLAYDHESTLFKPLDPQGVDL